MPPMATSAYFASCSWTSWGTMCLPDRVHAILDHPEPTYTQEWQQFLGVYNFYRRFYLAAAQILRPLTESLMGTISNMAPGKWTEVMRTTFKVAKVALGITAELAHPARGQS